MTRRELLVRTGQTALLGLASPALSQLAPMAPVSDQGFIISEFVAYVNIEWRFIADNPAACARIVNIGEPDDEINASVFELSRAGVTHGAH